MRHVSTLGVAVAVAVAIAVIAAPSTAAKPPPFDWSVPDRLGLDRDGDGLIDYAGSAEAVSAGPFAVELAVEPGLCRERSTYRWSVEGRQIGGGRGECVLRHRFAEEGAYDVELEVEDTAGEHESYSREVIVQDWLVVSIGDSVASGEGSPDARGLRRRARWHSPRCHRSTLAAPARAALALEAADSRTSTTFVHLACSGAALQSGLLEGYEGIDVADGADPPLLPPQISELEAIASQREIDAVLVSIGANDAYFGAVVAFCLRFSNCIARNFDPEHPDRGGLGSNRAKSLPVGVAKAIERLRAGYATLGARLGAFLDPGRVLVVDYFDPTRGRNGKTCRKIGVPFLPHFHVDRGEAAWAYSNILQPLNEEIALAAGREGWVHVSGAAEIFRTHGYCAGRESWIRTLAGSVLSQAGEHAFSRVAGMLHPNPEGHREIATLVGGALQRLLYAGQAVEPPPPVEEEIGSDDDGTDVERLVPIALIAAFGLVLAALAICRRGGSRRSRRRSD